MMSAGVQVWMTESEWYESLRKDNVWQGWSMREWALRKIQIVFVLIIDLKPHHYSFSIGPWRVWTNSN